MADFIDFEAKEVDENEVIMVSDDEKDEQSRYVMILLITMLLLMKLTHPFI